MFLFSNALEHEQKYIYSVVTKVTIFNISLLTLLIVIKNNF